MITTRPLLRLIALVVAGAALATALTSPAAAHDSTRPNTAAVVVGAGHGTLTDPDGLEFPVASYHLIGAVAADGSAFGTIRFSWRGPFPRVWGDPVCDGSCDRIVLSGIVESGSIASDGSVTLSGTAREVDKRRGTVVFDSGFDEPFTIVAHRGDDEFTLQWCLLPPFEVEGFIRVWTRRNSRVDSPMQATESRQQCGR